MILILSSNSDLSSDIVCDYLETKNYPFLRINSSQLLEDEIQIKLQGNNVEVVINKVPLPINEIRAVWLRKFLFYQDAEHSRDSKNKVNEESYLHLKKEYSSLLYAFISIFKNKKWITSPECTYINKFDILRSAAEAGLDIPNSYLTNSLYSLDQINEKAIISKSIKDPLFQEFDGYSFLQFTHIVNQEFKEKLSDKFFTSFFQEQIIKEYELRVFHFFGKNFSMAIFPKKEKEKDTTLTDFRYISSDFKNRNVPYNLPKDISLKINTFMKNINLNCGSIDIMKSSDNHYYFLEVNPLGQFGMVDFPCNFGLHKLVATKLIELDQDI